MFPNGIIQLRRYGQLRLIFRAFRSPDSMSRWQESLGWLNSREVQSVYSAGIRIHTSLEVSHQPGTLPFDQTITSKSIWLARKITRFGVLLAGENLGEFGTFTIRLLQVFSSCSITRVTLDTTRFQPRCCWVFFR